MNSLKLGEVVTDASRVIMKMVRELKGIFKFLFLIFPGASFFCNKLDVLIPNSNQPTYSNIQYYHC